MRLLFFFSWLFLASSQLSAQKTETLTNASVISLHKAELGDELIIQKIETSACKFDVSTTGLVALKKAGLSKEVIQAMMDKASGKKATTTEVAPARTSSGTTSTTRIPEPESINAVHFYDRAAQTVTALERRSASLKSEKKALGFGGVQMVYEIEGDKAAVRTPGDTQPAFVVNTGGGASDIFVLYKVEVKKGKRRAVAAQWGAGGNIKGSKGIITLDVRQLKPNLYELVPSAKLEKGEYFFANKTVTTATTNADVFAFGID